jgi:hypothetical protein
MMYGPISISQLFCEYANVVTQCEQLNPISVQLLLVHVVFPHHVFRYLEQVIFDVTLSYREHEKSLHA